jgi:hypothetical protein
MRVEYYCLVGCDAVWSGRNILCWIINIVRLLYILATVVAILRHVHYEGYIIEVLEPLYKCKILAFEMYDLKYVY